MRQTKASERPSGLPKMTQLEWESHSGAAYMVLILKQAHSHIVGTLKILHVIAHIHSLLYRAANTGNLHGISILINHRIASWSMKESRLKWNENSSYINFLLPHIQVLYLQKNQKS